MRNAYDISEEIKNIVINSLGPWLEEGSNPEETIENMRQEIQWCLEDSDNK